MLRPIFTYACAILVVTGADVAVAAQPMYQYDCRIENGYSRNTKKANIRIQNTGTNPMSSGLLNLRIKIFDCPKQRFSEKECLAIADKVVPVGHQTLMEPIGDKDIPPGQARDYILDVQFQHNVNIRGVEFRSYTLSYFFDQMDGPTHSSQEKSWWEKLIN